MRLSELIGRREQLSAGRGRVTLGGGLIWADIWVRSGWREQPILARRPIPRLN